jgi:hypothetical protein
MVKWEQIGTSVDSGIVCMWRATVPGGWLVIVTWGETALTFYPDPNHEWDGSSLP